MRYNKQSVGSRKDIRLVYRKCFIGMFVEGHAGSTTVSSKCVKKWYPMYPKRKIQSFKNNSDKLTSHNLKRSIREEWKWLYRYFVWEGVSNENP